MLCLLCEMGARGAERPVVVVRNVDPELWRELRAEAVRRGLKVGELLNQVIQHWLLQKDKPS